MAAYFNLDFILILNKSDIPLTIDLSRYSEIGLEGKKLQNIITGEEILWADSLQLNSRGVIILTSKFN